MEKSGLSQGVFREEWRPQRRPPLPSLRQEVPPPGDSRTGEEVSLAVGEQAGHNKLGFSSMMEARVKNSGFGV